MNLTFISHDKKLLLIWIRKANLSIVTTFYSYPTDLKYLFKLCVHDTFSFKIATFKALKAVAAQQNKSQIIKPILI